MHWAVAVTTAPRPKSTLERTLAGLRRTGWAEYRVFEDTTRAGAWRTWLAALRELTTQQADAYLICQDDAVFCRGLRNYLEKTLWPAGPVALCSPYCPTPYKRTQCGWHEENRGWNLVGAVCWTIPPESGKAILAALDHVEAERQVDARVGQWATETGRSVWYHTPSLVQHIGSGNSALGDPLVIDLRTATDFIGEHSSASQKAKDGD